MLATTQREVPVGFFPLTDKIIDRRNLQGDCLGTIYPLP